MLMAVGYNAWSWVIVEGDSHLTGAQLYTLLRLRPMGWETYEGKQGDSFRTR